MANHTLYGCTSSHRDTAAAPSCHHRPRHAMHGLSHASLALALAPALALVLARGAAAVRHSVLHIIVDDLRPELGAYGLPGARQNACRQDTAPLPPPPMP